jgi:hypothetical protein
MAFEKGMSRPEGAGRKKGQTNGDTAKLRELILGALDAKGGQEWLELQMDEQPVAMLSLIGKVLPKEVVAEVKAEVKTDVYLRPQLTKEEWIEHFSGKS